MDPRTAPALPPLLWVAQEDLVYDPDSRTLHRPLAVPSHPDPNAPLRCPRGQEFYVRGVTVSTVRWGKVTSATVYILDYDVLPRLWGEAPEVAEVMNASG